MGADSGSRKPPRPPGATSSMLLALLAHALLGVLLLIGVRWQTAPPQVVDAELWAPLPRQAAPVPSTPPPIAPPPAEQVQPKPLPERPVPQVQPKPVERPVDTRAADIARQRQIEKRQQELLEQEAAAQRKAAAAARKQQAELAEQRAREKLALAEQQRAQQRQDENLKRLIAQASVPAQGNEERSAGPKGNPDYASKIDACIRPRVNFNEASVAGNPQAIFDVELLPDGTVASVRLNKSSGNRALDEAAERGIRRCDPFPRPGNGPYPRTLTLTYTPKKVGP